MSYRAQRDGCLLVSNPSQHISVFRDEAKVCLIEKAEVKDSPVAGADAPGRTDGQRNAWKLEAHSSLTVPITAEYTLEFEGKNKK